MSWGVLLTGLLWATAAAANAAEPAAWSLDLSHDRRGSAAAMKLSVRWDVSDLKASPVRLAKRAAKVLFSADTSGRALLRGTRLRFHGLRVQPFRHWIPAPETAVASAPIAAQAVPAEGWEALEADARREAKRWLVQAAFDLALPNASGVPRWQKETVASDLAAAGRSWSDLN